MHPLSRSIVSRPFVALTLLALCLAPLRAAERKYLPAGTPDAIALLSAPPTAGSAEDRADLDTTDRVCHAATADERARAIDEITLTVFHFAPVLGAWFRPSECPKTAALFKQVETESKQVTNAAKKHWQRIRPYHADPDRFPLAIEHEPATDYSYPSGHSTRGTVYALLLAELFPEKRKELIVRGRETGWLRVVGGVHYPTDIYAGRVLGQALAREFLKSAEFQAALAEARTELTAARPAEPAGSHAGTY